jgi:hypothetical protein
VGGTGASTVGATTSAIETATTATADLSGVKEYLFEDTALLTGFGVRAPGHPLLLHLSSLGCALLCQASPVAYLGDEFRWSDLA